MDQAPFSYSLNASTIRPTPILKQIQIAAQAGYTGIELWHDAIDHFITDGGTLKDIQQCLKDHGLKVPTTIYLGDWFDADDNDFPQILSECQRKMQQAAFLGAPHVIAGPPGGQADYEKGARRYGQLLDAGKEIGTLPAMEFLGFVDQLNSIEEAIKILDRVNSPDATTVLDPFHIFRGGGSIQSIQRLKSNQIAVAHFNDTPSTPERTQQHDHHRVMPGEGHLVLQDYVRQLQNIGFRGWLSLELFNEALWEKDPSEVASVGLAKMREIAES